MKIAIARIKWGRICKGGDFWGWDWITGLEITVNLGQGRALKRIEGGGEGFGGCVRGKYT
jgi:hypothetical protein